jgi:hypothetical protein
MKEYYKTKERVALPPGLEPGADNWEQAKIASVTKHIRKLTIVNMLL